VAISDRRCPGGLFEFIGNKRIVADLILSMFKGVRKAELWGLIIRLNHRFTSLPLRSEAFLGKYGK
jgi:hypothetical protein